MGIDVDIVAKKARAQWYKLGRECKINVMGVAVEAKEDTGTASGFLHSRTL